jgi:hypothetical protein
MRFKQAVIFFVMLVILNLNFVSVSALSVVVHVPEKYTDVRPGERFYFEIEVKYPENFIRKDLRLEYEILKDNELIAQAKVLKAIETQASFIDFIIIPEGAQAGLYSINVKIKDYEDLSEEVSASFHVQRAIDQIKIYFLIILGLVLIIGILVIIDILRKK